MSSGCTVTTPPAIEDGKVVLTLVHDASGQAFRCELTDFDDVVVSAVPVGFTPSSEGDARGEAAQAALAHARENAAEFQALFDQL